MITGCSTGSVAPTRRWLPARCTAAGRLDPVGMARAAGADLLMPHWSFVTREDVGLCHAAGLSVFPWTVDEPELIRNVAQAGVDGIVSNWPDRVMELRESAG